MFTDILVCSYFDSTKIYLTFSFLIQRILHIGKVWDVQPKIPFHSVNIFWCRVGKRKQDDDCEIVFTFALFHLIYINNKSINYMQIENSRSLILFSSTQLLPLLLSMLLFSSYLSFSITMMTIHTLLFRIVVNAYTHENDSLAWQNCD